ncbi:MAG: NAD(P) transhydrogenase subunit alpha [Candidatus Aminicenantes bacterium RBG_16_63_16]|nr:MAG: NAD(P) transhydrogenase subunit alpha [Candidatus Aminicenantes bacterium RBG_16_63_16]
MKKSELVVGVVKELHEGCRCVAVVPQSVRGLVSRGHRVIVQNSVGVKSFYLDEFYADAGASLAPSAASIYGEADVILKIRPPVEDKKTGRHELDLMKPGAAIISFLAPTLDRRIVEKLVAKRLTGFSMELIPRLSRAQSMDALSSLGTVMGYRAALLAADLSGKFFPLLMTAAGTIPPVNVLVIGAGVAGLQAIATSKRLGARVEAFDTRPAVKEQVESLGAKFLEMELPPDAETKFGYAKESSPEFVRKEMELLSSRLPRTDVVITTALVYGRTAPTLITEDMVKLMAPGSVIIDLAAEQGGNCVLSRPGEVVEKHGVSVYGALDMPSQLPLHTSLMYSRNVVNAFHNLYAGEDDTIDLTDEINAHALVTFKGDVTSELVREFLARGGGGS